MASFSGLEFQNLNQNASKSLVLLHGIFGSSNEFLLLSTQYLTEYHLLIPDCHSFSSPSENFTLPLICSQIANIIRIHAHGSKASIAGCSMGGNIALYLAAHYPEVIDEIEGGVLASGVSSFSKGNFLWEHIVPLWFVLEGHLISIILPAGVFGEGQAVAEQINKENKELRTYANCKQVFQALGSNKFEPVRARTLIVCSTLSNWRKGYFCDSPKDALEVRKSICSDYGNGASQAVSVPSCSHPWNFQKPRLFAEVLKAWLERGDLPDEVIVL